MAERTPECAKCGRPMEPGFVVDHGHGETHQGTWVEGAPVHSIWTGIKLRGKERLPVTAYRCPGCGYLEFYAPST